MRNETLLLKRISRSGAAAVVWGALVVCSAASAFGEEPIYEFGGSTGATGTRLGAISAALGAGERPKSAYADARTTASAKPAVGTNPTSTPTPTFAPSSAGDSTANPASRTNRANAEGAGAGEKPLLASIPPTGTVATSTFNPNSKGTANPNFEPFAAGAVAETVDAAKRRAFRSGETNPTDGAGAISLPTDRPAFDVGDAERFEAENRFGTLEERGAAVDSTNGIVEYLDENGVPNDLGAELDADEEPATTERIADECFCALDPYSSLFIEYPPTATWTNDALIFVEDVLAKLDVEPDAALALVKEFRAKIAEGESLKQAIIFDAKNWDAPANGGGNGTGGTVVGGVLGDSDVPPNSISTDKPTLVARYTLEQRLDAFDAFRSALERRAFVWGRAAEYFAVKNDGTLVPPRDFADADLFAIRRTTEAARAYFGDSQTGRDWRTSFELDLLAEDVGRFIATPKPTGSDARAVLKERKRRATYLRDRIGSIQYKIEKTPMTAGQRRVFERAPLADWVATIAPFACDQNDGLALLLDFEKYERTGGGEVGRTLQQNARRQTTSKSDVCRRFGQAFDAVYDNPNVKTYVSEALINRLLPTKDPEFDVVRETVMNNPVEGRRRADAEVFIKLVPDPSRLLMKLNVAGRVVASTSSEVFPAKLYNKSYASYFGQKTLEWRDDGIAYSPAVVSADSVSELSGVETDVDFVPLVGDLAREVVRTQYEARRDRIRQETKARVANEARARIDQESDERFDEANRRLRENFFADLARLELSLKTQRSKTTEEWLLASLRFGSDFSLGCQTTEPRTLPGAFADVKLHESAVNAFLEKLELGGKSGTPRAVVSHLARRLNRPKLEEIEIQDSDLTLTFADVDPVVVRFFEDSVSLRLNFAALTLGESTWNDVSVAVAYRPTLGPTGVPTIVRDGVVELDGPLNIRSQIPLRAIFSKVFPAEKAFDLPPDLFKTEDGRFAGLRLGEPRVANGWLALSIVYSDDAASVYSDDAGNDLGYVDALKRGK